MTKQLCAAILAVGALASNDAWAADGTVTVTGQITGTTCPITGGTGPAPGSGANFPVALDKVQTSALKAAGEVAGSKPFFIYVGDSTSPCTAQSVAVLFESTSPGIDPLTGNLRNTAASPATNVQVQIVDGTLNTPIDLRLGAQSTPVIPANGIATLPFAARYIATGTVAEGGVQADVLYSIAFP